jgi:uncharacterized protein YbaR (Trm112 family)
MVHAQHLENEEEEGKFLFTKTARKFPIVDALPYMWPSSASLASEYIQDWKTRAGNALARYKLSKRTMTCIASHTSRKTGSCPLSDRALASRSGRTIPSTKRDICRLKKLGFLIAEIRDENGYRNRTRSLVLSLPDVIDEDQRIPQNDDQRIPLNDKAEWRSTYQAYVDPSDKGERRDV